MLKLYKNLWGDEMEIRHCRKEAFSVIGKEGSTNDGADFIEVLWQEANGNFNEVAEFAKKNEVGGPVGIWGLMSDFTRSFKPWEDNFSKGLYLAGVEVENDAVAPTGWVKWTSPAYEYIYIKVEGDMMKAFEEGLEYIKREKFELVGAVYDYICPEEAGQLYLFFPIKKL